MNSIDLAHLTCSMKTTYDGALSFFHDTIGQCSLYGIMAVHTRQDEGYLPANKASDETTLLYQYYIYVLSVYF